MRRSRSQGEEGSERNEGRKEKGREKKSEGLIL